MLEKEKKDLMANWIKCKFNERRATALRIAAEVDILKFYPAKDEGTRTDKVDELTLTITQTVRRKIDKLKAEEVCEAMPNAPIVWEKIPKLDLIKYRFLKENQPGLFALFSNCITESKGKPNIKIEAKYRTI